MSLWDNVVNTVTTAVQQVGQEYHNATEIITEPSANVIDQIDSSGTIGQGLTEIVELSTGANFAESGLAGYDTAHLPVTYAVLGQAAPIAANYATNGMAGQLGMGYESGFDFNSLLSNVGNLFDQKPMQGQAGVTMSAQPAPEYSYSKTTNYLPWILGGAGVLIIGFLLIKRK